MKLAGEEMRHLRESTSRDAAADEVKNLREKFLEFQVAANAPRDDRDAVARNLEAQLAKHTTRGARRAVHEAPAPASESPRLKALERSIADIATGLKDDMARLRESTARDHAAGALASLSEKVSALQSRRPEEPASTRRRQDELRHLQQTMLDVQRQTRDAAEGKHADVSASVRNLEQQLASHSASLRDEMRHVTDGAARSAAAEELRRLHETVAELKRRPDAEDGSAVAVKALELQLQQHTATIRDAITSTRSGDPRADELRSLQQQVVELREKSRADAAISAAMVAMTPTKDATMEREFEKHTSALRAYGRVRVARCSSCRSSQASRCATSGTARRDRAEEIKILTDRVGALSSSDDGGALKALETQLNQHTAIKETNAAGDARSRDARDDLRRLQEQVLALQEKQAQASAAAIGEIRDRVGELRRTAADQGTAAGRLEASIAAQTAQLKDDAATNHDSAERDVVKVLEAQLAGHTRSLREAIVERRGETEGERALRAELEGLKSRAARAGRGQKDAAESLEAQLAQHTKTLTAAIEGGRGEDRRDDELRRLQAQVDDVRRQAEAAARPKTAPAPAPTDDETKAAARAADLEGKLSSAAAAEASRATELKQQQDLIRQVQSQLEATQRQLDDLRAPTTATRRPPRRRGKLRRRRRELAELRREREREALSAAAAERAALDSAMKAQTAEVAALKLKLSEREAEPRPSGTAASLEAIQKQLEDLASSRTRRGRRRDGDSSGDEASDHLKLLRRDLADLKRSRRRTPPRALEDIAKQLGDVRQSQAPQVEDHHDEELLLRSRGARANRRSRQRYQADDDESPSAAAPPPGGRGGPTTQRAQRGGGARAMDVVQRQLGALAGLDAYDAPRTARAPARRRPTTTPTRPSCPASRCWPRAGDAYAASSLDAVRGRLGAMRERRFREAQDAERLERRALRSTIHAARRDVAGEGQELRQMLGLMQDQLKTLDRVVGPEPFAATPRRDEPRDAVFEAPAPPPADDALKTLKHIQAQLADAQAARNEEAASRETAVKELAAELEVLKREKKESAWTSDVLGKAREDAAETLRLSIEPLAERLQGLEEARAKGEAGDGARDEERRAKAADDLRASFAAERSGYEARVAALEQDLAAAEARAAKAQEDKAAADEDRDDAASRLEALERRGGPDALVDRSRVVDALRAQLADADAAKDRAERATDASAAPPGDSGGEQPPADASSRAIVFFDALAFDPTDLVVNDACPALAEHLRIDPSTPCTILGDGDSRSAAATRLAFFAVELDGRGLRLPRRRRRHARRRGGGPDIFAETAQRLAARSNVARGPAPAVGRRPTPRVAARGVWTTAADAEPAWLANKRAVLVSDLYAYVRTVCRGVLVDLGAAERAGIVFAAGRRPVGHGRVTAFSVAPEEAEIDKGEELRLFRRLATELRTWLRHALPPPHELVLSRSGIAPFLQSRLVLRNYQSCATPTTSHVRYAVAVFGKALGLEWFASRERNGASIVRAVGDAGPAPAPELLLQAESPVDGARELQRDLAAQQLVDDLHAWLRRSGCTEVSCADLVPFYGAFPRYRKGGGQGSGIKHAIVRFGGAKLSWVETRGGGDARDRLALAARGPGPPPPPAYAPFAAAPPFAPPPPPPPPPPSPPGLGADDDAARLVRGVLDLVIGDDEVEAFATPVKGSPPPSETSTAASGSSESSFASASWPWARAALTPIPAPAAPGLSRLQPPTTPWDQAAERYRPLDVGFAPFRLPAPSREALPDVAGGAVASSRRAPSPPRPADHRLAPTHAEEAGPPVIPRSPPFL
ncbi:alpha-methylacyl-CoA racemase [Aureococcus anophagefferens]|nr:alpha-methylacyl-CoA racemase [Aureococcus anophagefferens]